MKHIVRSCEKTYSEDEIRAKGIDVTELKFDDGKLPTQDVIDQWLKIVDDFFDPLKTITKNKDNDFDNIKDMQKEQ